MSKDVKNILGLFAKQRSFASFLVWRVLLILVAYLGVSRFPIAQTFFGKFNFFESFANWDGGHYLGIAQNGYLHIFQYAFFPFYPILIKIFSFLTLGNYFLAGYLISSLSLVGAVVFLEKLVKEKFNEQLAWKVIIYFLIFPSSIFLAAAYSESLFLFLVISSYYFSQKHSFFQKQKWFLASFLAFFATATKFIGIFLVICLVIEYFSQINFSVRKVKKDILFLLISPLGLIFYMYFLFNQVGDPLFFMHTQTYWHRSTEVIYPVLTVVKGGMSLFAEQRTGSFYGDKLLIIKSFELFATLIFFFSSVFIYKKISKSLGIYTFLVVVFPLFSGTLDSMSRYVLAGWPFFILLAVWGQNKWFNLIYIIFGLIFLSFFTILFVTGNWVG